MMHVRKAVFFYQKVVVRLRGHHFSDDEMVICLVRGTHFVAGVFVFGSEGKFVVTYMYLRSVVSSLSVLRPSLIGVK